ncbi:MAG TPA: DUF1697 domain-containing protein [Candidatus Sulfotelmatobacter sp.]|nr:DUF1697 domain-containing protein [Candidatus Sulfotelmatobacter sp.]
MPVMISMLRGINLGPHHRIKMDALRSLYLSLGFQDPRTYVQSGNVIFWTRQRNTKKIAGTIQDAIEKTFKFRPAVILRTAEELKNAIAATPFPEKRNLDPGKILVTFLAHDPPRDASSKLVAFNSYPEEIHLQGRELYIYFPKGAGRSKLPWSRVEQFLKVTGTARNWNSVLAMLQIAQEMERS